MGLKIPSRYTYSNINNKIDQLYATNNYSFINYDIVNENGRNILKLNVAEDQNRIFMKFGLHYDEVLKQVFWQTLPQKSFIQNSNASLDVVFGDKPRYYFNYLMDNGYIPGFGIYSSGMKLDLKIRMQMYTKTGIGSGMKFISSRYGKTDTPSEED